VGPNVASNTVMTPLSSNILIHIFEPNRLRFTDLMEPKDRIAMALEASLDHSGTCGLPSAMVIPKGAYA
jgi:hypothetical protein